jgi:hypothetical protein
MPEENKGYGGGYYVRRGDDDEDDEEIKISLENRILVEYTPGITRFTQFVSESKADGLFYTLAEFGTKV